MVNLATVSSGLGGSTTLSGVERSAKLNETEIVTVESTRPEDHVKLSPPASSHEHIKERRPGSSASSDEDMEFVNRSKDRFRRRLRDRWNCRVPGHTYCYATLDGGSHVPLSPEAIEIWVSALYKLEATLLTPPDSISPQRTPQTQTDAASVLSTSSRRTIEYQRRFRWQVKPSLTDLRSARNVIRSAMASRSKTSSQTSNASIEQNIGCGLGSAALWVGMHMLDLFGELEIRRRRWVIGKFLKTMERIADRDRAKWILSKKRQVDHVVVDLLELSSDSYKLKYFLKARNQGVSLRKLLSTSPISEVNPDEQEYLRLLSLESLPLSLFGGGDISTEDLASDLRETLLQDPAEPPDKKSQITDLVSHVCFELAYANSSPWRGQGYEALWYFYRTAHGERVLWELEKCGHLMEDLAIRAFSSTEQANIIERANAVRFFARYANDVPNFREHLLKPLAIPLLIERLKHHDEAAFLCTILSNVSNFNWCIHLLVELDACPHLVTELIQNQRVLGIGQLLNYPWITYDCVRALRNLTIRGGESGKTAVREATTEELIRVLPGVVDIVNKVLGEVAALAVRTWIEETWPSMTTDSVIFTGR